VRFRGVSAAAGIAPSGMVTLLPPMGTVRPVRWEANDDGIRAALAAHDEVLRTAIEAHGGWLFKHTGDRLCAAFAASRCALDAAAAARRVLPADQCRAIGPWARS